MLLTYLHRACMAESPNATVRATPSLERGTEYAKYWYAFFFAPLSIIRVAL